jgi:4-carboxymuconolactone decarboxylase
MSDADRYAAGMAVRRHILGDAHVDRAEAGKTPFTADFQEYITRCAWEVWTRPGLDHHTRRLLVIGTMVALGRWEEFRMHVRAALEAGLPMDDVKEVLMQQGVYCGVPAANTAFHHAAEVARDLAADGVVVQGAWR